MSFANLFSAKKSTESVVFMDIGTDSVAGAYVHYADGQPPAILYTRRIPIELHAGEPHETGMLRALKELGNTLITEGAPTLVRATGHGHADSILVSVDAPWQRTTVRNEKIEQKEAFTFTKDLVADVLKKSHVPLPGKVLADESVIGTTLNGYETHDPYGKKVHRAYVVVLTSFIDEQVAAGIAATLRSLYHTKQIQLIVGSSLRYQAIRIAFPHERDALILDAAGPLTSIALVRKNLLVAVNEMSDEGVANTPEGWIQKVKDELAAIAKQFPLPRTIFLLSPEKDIAMVQSALEKANIGSLWLSDNPLKIVPVLASHIASLVKQVSPEPPDLPLLLMAIFWKNRTPEQAV